MNDRNERSFSVLGGLNYPAGIFQKSKKIFDDAYNELRDCRDRSTGDGEEAQQARTAIAYFVQLLDSNGMLNYLVKFQSTETPHQS